ncbi:hypothetical protein PMZ80_008730 [Knufia obscura]|uniref:Uncharacterized protein n=2 Tax=Knufia TaxID=430999 RepID=A0AAN8EFL2_9EURO|nr:hypothetical protein PMZ80_008730 [Knufia obscura]KAK5948480.1 hypothetical protein OHC33_010514 [Knufia fluminis]
MKQKMAAASINGDWIHMFCRNCTFTFGASGNIWKLFKRLGPEREVILNDDGKLATALYQCARIEDGKVVQQEIMKIYMQTSGDALEGLPQQITREIAALNRLREVKEKEEVPAPHMIVYRHKQQPAHTWVPGGFVVFTIMKRLPGSTLSLKATVWDAGIDPWNSGIENLRWDKVDKKCYISYNALEGACSYSEPCDLVFTEEMEFYKWGFLRWLGR